MAASLSMNLPIRFFALAVLFAGAAACQTHDRVIYDQRTPKNLRVIRPGDTPEIPLDSSGPVAKPGAGAAPVAPMPAPPPAL